MNKLMSICLLCLTVAVACIPVRAGERHAFLIGVSQYGAGFSPLEFTENDVTQLAQAMQLSGYDSRNIVVLTETRGQKNGRDLPTSTNIRDRLTHKLSELEADDTIVVAFSGHGLQFVGDDSAWLCPRDANLSQIRTLISVDEVFDLLGDPKKCAANNRLVIIDACRNDPFVANAKTAVSVELNPTGFESIPAPPGGLVAYISCSRNQLSYEHKEIEHGIFIATVIDAFGGHADTDDNQMTTLPELEAYCSEYTKAYADTRLTVKQVPERFGASRGVITLGSVPDPKPQQIISDPNGDRRSVIEVPEFSLTGIPQNGVPKGWASDGLAGRMIHDGTTIIGRPGIGVINNDFGWISPKQVRLPDKFTIHCEVYAPGDGMCRLKLTDVNGETLEFTVRARGRSNGNLRRWIVDTKAQLSKYSLDHENEHGIFEVRRDGQVIRLSLMDKLLGAERVNNFDAVASVEVGIDPGGTPTGIMQFSATAQ